MKIITTNDSTIHVERIDSAEHIVVANIDGNPCILGKGYDEPTTCLSFFIIGSMALGKGYQPITRGNGYNIGDDYDTVAKMVLKAIDMGYEVEVFHKTDWVKALEWLINISKK